jgi:hypothetical protein
MHAYGFKEKSLLFTSRRLVMLYRTEYPDEESVAAREIAYLSRNTVS